MYFILFYRPRKTDECDTCTSIKISMKKTPENIEDLEAKMAQHKVLYKAQQTNLQNHEQTIGPRNQKDPKSPWVTIATDLQQTQPLPRLVNQSSFYKKKVRFLFSSNDICCIILTSK